MSTIFDILVSDGVVALHLLLTMILLAVVILGGIQFDLKLRRMSGESTELRRLVRELSDVAYGGLSSSRKRMDRHQDAILHTADYLSGNAKFDERNFAALSAAPGQSFVPAESDDVPDVYFSHSDDPGPDMSMVDSAFVEPQSEYVEPDVSMPLRASMVTMPADMESTVADEMREAADEALPAQADVITRVLHRSRGQ